VLTDAKEGAVVQLKLLDLMIRNQSEAVPVDSKARADLIDLMARILVAVFQVEGGKVDDGGPVQSQEPLAKLKHEGHFLFRGGPLPA
jgi:hypothetical protein